MTGGVRVAVVVAGLVLALLVLALMLHSARARLARRTTEHLAGRTPLRHDGWASFFGARSRGLRQLRGNGALVLTADDLWFGMLLPARELTIPLHLVTAVDSARSHLGKAVVGHPLLRVEFTSEDETDVAAWAVRDLDGWLAAVRAAVAAASAGSVETR